MIITDIKGSWKLHNGVEMPYLGIGTWKCANGEEAINTVTTALKNGYRHIDTASIYMNEEGVGEGILKSGIQREEIFLTSKVWNKDQGYDQTMNAIEASLKKLKTDYLDLYLVHWPVEGKYKDTWKALETIYRDGRVKAIGVSNFMKHHLEDLLESADITPMVNQMEFHPYLVQQELLEYCKSLKIQYEAWTPLMKGTINDVELLVTIGQKYDKTPAQITLRWSLQKGVVSIPKTVHEHRMIENADLFDFTLNETEIVQIDKLEKGYRFGPDPENFDF